MEEPIAIGVVAEKVGMEVMAVAVFRMSIDIADEYTILHLPFGESGAAGGVWQNGFHSGDLPSENEREYFCRKFGMSPGKVSPYDFRRLSQMYLKARERMLAK